MAESTLDKGVAAAAPTAPAVDLLALIEASGSADARQIEFARTVLASAKTAGKVTLRAWPIFADDPTVKTAVRAEPIYEGDRNQLRHIFSRAALAASVELGSAPGQFRVDFRSSDNVVEYRDARTGAISVERVMAGVIITLVEKAAKATAPVTRSSRF
jgi:hypothetical protein